MEVRNIVKSANDVDFVGILLDVWGKFELLSYSIYSSRFEMHIDLKYRQIVLYKIVRFWNIEEIVKGSLTRF